MKSRQFLHNSVELETQLNQTSCPIIRVLVDEVSFTSHRAEKMSCEEDIAALWNDHRRFVCDIIPQHRRHSIKDLRRLGRIRISKVGLRIYTIMCTDRVANEVREGHPCVSR